MSTVLALAFISLQELFEKGLRLWYRPFESWEAFVATLSRGPSVFLSLESKTGLLYLIAGFLTALAVYYIYRRELPEEYRGSALSYIFPRSIYTHPSAIVDYKFVGFDLLVRFFIYFPLVAGTGQLVYVMLNSFEVDLSFGLFVESHYYVRLAIVTLIGIAALDFSVFFSHYLLHKIPFLWPFHEVHHSAEVLTPVTVHRNHPMDDMVNGIVYGVVGGSLAATYTAVSGNVVSELTIFGLNIFTFAYYISVYQLRHSHIWLSYGPIMSHIFVSPAQHQIHHSIDRKHWNKNYGFTFAIWDWMFGCLYVPKEREEIKFGVPEVDPADFSTVPRLYFLPFAKSYRRLIAMIKARSLRFDFDEVAQSARLAQIPESDVNKEQPLTVRTSYAQPK